MHAQTCAHTHPPYQPPTSNPATTSEPRVLRKSSSRGRNQPPWQKAGAREAFSEVGVGCVYEFAVVCVRMEGTVRGHHSWWVWMCVHACSCVGGSLVLRVFFFHICHSSPLWTSAHGSQLSFWSGSRPYQLSEIAYFLEGKMRSSCLE